MNLIYIADPMCSWCYGFARSLSALLADPGEVGVELELVMGGLRPGTTEPLAPARADEIFGLWRRVHLATGQSFAPAPHTALHLPGFVYNTEPACRAVVTLRQHWPTQAWAYLNAVQQAFYAEARDVTRTDVLSTIAAGLGLPRSAFQAAFESDDMREQTRHDFAQTQSWGIRSFPALMAEHAGQLHLVCKGYAPADVLRQQLLTLQSDSLSG